MKKFWIPLLLSALFVLALSAVVAFQILGIVETRNVEGIPPATFPEQVTTAPETSAGHRPSAGEPNPPILSDFRLVPQGPPVAAEQDNVYAATRVAEIILPSIVSVNVELEDGVAYGTGIVVSSDGYIVTNEHVVEGYLSIAVVFLSGESCGARFLGADPTRDVALLKIDATGLTPAILGDSEQLSAGDFVVAVGNPGGMGLEGSVSVGVVSALNRLVVVGSYPMQLIQTDAAINPGSSGGALCNAYGQVVGLTSASLVSIGGAHAESLNFAVPANTVAKIVNDLMTLGYVQGRPLLGIDGHDIDAFEARDENVPLGVMVDYVDPNSDAHAKGLTEGDVITHVEEERVYNMNQLTSHKDAMSPGDTLRLTLSRGGETLQISIVLYERTTN